MTIQSQPFHTLPVDSCRWTLVNGLLTCPLFVCADFKRSTKITEGSSNRLYYDCAHLLTSARPSGLLNLSGGHFLHHLYFQGSLLISELIKIAFLCFFRAYISACYSQEQGWCGLVIQLHSLLYFLSYSTNFFCPKKLSQKQSSLFYFGYLMHDGFLFQITTSQKERELFAFSSASSNSSLCQAIAYSLVGCATQWKGNGGWLLLRRLRIRCHDTMEVTSNFLLKLSSFTPAHSFSLLLLIVENEMLFRGVGVKRGMSGHELHQYVV